jgi:3',5'-cyclic AMP phosphodiesterase CpdA
VRVLHLSDVHVQIDWSAQPAGKIGWRRSVARLELGLGGRSKRYEGAEGVLQRIAEAAASVDHVVLSGDLTALAADEEFERAKAALGAITDDPRRFTVIPGNHDVYTPGAARAERFEKWFGHLLRSDLPDLTTEGPWPLVRLVGATLALVCLRSARVPPLPGIAAGWIGQPQLEALRRICTDKRLQGRAIYVVVHHAPVRWNGTPDRPAHGLRDREALLQTCREGNVAAILCGHVHRRCTVDVGGGVTVVNAGSSTQLGHEGYFLLEDAGGKLASATPVSLAGAA